MSATWNRISPWIDKYQYAFTTMSVAIGISTIWMFFTKDKIDSQSDLQLISGKLSHYSFTRGNRGSKKYFLWLTKYQSTFQIPADYISYFNEQDFVKHALPNAEVQLRIAKSRVGDFNEGKQVIIFELISSQTNYLDSNLTIAENKKKTLFYAGSFFILAGFLFFFYRKSHPYRNN